MTPVSDPSGPVARRTPACVPTPHGLLALLVRLASEDRTALVPTVHHINSSARYIEASFHWGVQYALIPNGGR